MVVRAGAEVYQLHCVLSEKQESAGCKLSTCHMLFKRATTLRGRMSASLPLDADWLSAETRSSSFAPGCCAREYAVNFGGHDEIVLMQSLDLLGLQRDRGIAPAEADIRMMAFSLREFANFLNKGERLPEIAKSEAPLDPVSFLQ